MESRLLRRPLTNLLSTRSQCLLALNSASRRHESSYRRTKKRLNIGPDSSFILNESSPKQDHIIFNPPSSAPSVLHTPPIFLPKTDPRRSLLFSTSLSPRLPPPIDGPQKVPHHHLTDKDIEEIKRLKRANPELWTNTKLGRKFNCSNYFVSICLANCGVDDSKHKAAMKAKYEAIAARWGPKKTKAHEERVRRFELAFRGD